MNLGQVYTRSIIADFMTSMFDLNMDSKVLDPCFGHGVFITSLLKNTPYNITGVEIDKNSYSSFSNPDTSRCTLIQGDFFDLTEMFDGIVMNPPYVRQEEIDDLSPLGVTKKKVQSICGLTPISSKANLYMYFILRSILLLKDAGQLIAIFPNSWENTPIGKEFLSNILRYGFIQRFISVEGNAFEGSPLVDVCIIKFIRGKSGNTERLKLTITDDKGLALSEDKRIFGKLSYNSLVTLKNIARVRRGITTGYNKVFINPPIFTKTHLVDILSSPKDVHGFSTKKSRQDKLLLLPANAKLDYEEKTYLDECSKNIIRDGKPKTLLDLIEKGATWYSMNIPEKAQIVFSYIIRSNMKFILNEGKCNVRDNFYMISSNYDPLLLFALLNNYHIYCQLETVGKSYGNGVLKLQTYDINNLMLPKIEILSDEDYSSLLQIGSTLACTSNPLLLDESTEILNKYYADTNSKERYLSLKEERLKKWE